MQFNQHSGLSGNTEEWWAEVEAYPRYMVSRHGDVMNKKTGRILKPAMNDGGYLFVTLWDERGQHHQYVHRLVALAFLEKDNREGVEVNHKDENGDKTNNHISNLEWATRHENIQHAFRNGLNHATRRTNVRPIEIVETGEVFESIAACARAIGGNKSLISQILKGAYGCHTNLGYHFRYVDQ